MIDTSAPQAPRGEASQIEVSEREAPQGAAPVGAASSSNPLRRRRVRRWAGLAVVVVLAVAAGWLLFFSSVFGVSDVTVSGAGGSLADDIRAAARITPGTPLTRVDTSAIGQRIKAVPAVATVRVGVSYPSTVTIAVTQRHAAVFTRDGARLLLTDPSGVVVKRTLAVPHDLPELLAPQGRSWSAAARRAALAVAGSLPASLRAQVASVSATDPASVTLTMRDHRTVVWGAAEDDADKATLVHSLLRKANSVIDVSEPGYVVTR